MKKFLSLFVLMAALSSCEDDVKFNNPAVQGFKNNELWKAEDFTATVGLDRSLTIHANNGFETLTLRAASYDAGTYQLGVGSSSVANFEFDADGILRTYSTNDELAGGQIIISPKPTETDLSQGFITGTFKFLAVDSDGVEVSFTQGHFYKVPITALAP